MTEGNEPQRLLEKLAKLEAEDDEGMKKYIAALKEYLGPFLTSVDTSKSTSKKKTLEAIARQHLSLLSKLLKESLSRLTPPPTPQPTTSATSSFNVVSHYYFEICFIALIAFEKLQPVISQTPSFDLDRQWSHLISYSSERGLYKESLLAISKLRERLHSLRSSSTAKPTKSTSSLLLPTERDTLDTVKIITSLIYHEFICLLSIEGSCTKVLTIIDKEWLQWLATLEKLDTKAALKYTTHASYQLQKMAAKSLNTSEGIACAKLGFILLSQQIKKTPNSSVSQFFIEASRSPLFVPFASDARMTGQIFALIVEVCKSEGFMPPPISSSTSSSSSYSPCPEFIEWCNRCATSLNASQIPEYSTLSIEVLSHCVDFIRDSNSQKEGTEEPDIQLGLAQLSLSLNCIQKVSSDSPSLLATAELNLSCAVELIGQVKETISYSLLYRATKFLDDLKRSAVQNWQQLGQSGKVVVQNSLIKSFGHAMLLFFDTATIGLKMDNDPKCKDAVTKQRFKPIQHYRVDALQCAMQSFQVSGTEKDIAQVLQRANSFVPMGDSSETKAALRRLSGMYYNYGVALYNAKNYQSAIEPLVKSCDYLEACNSSDEAKQAALPKKFELVAICHQRVGKNLRDALNSLSKSVFWSVKVGAEVPSSVVQRFVQICIKNFDAEPDIESMLSSPLLELGVEALSKVTELQFSIIQSRCAPISHQLAFLDYEIESFKSLKSFVNQAKTLIEKAKITRMASSDKDRYAKISSLLQEAIELLKSITIEKGENNSCLEELAIAYSWLGITLLESKREISSAENKNNSPTSKNVVNDEDLTDFAFEETSKALRSIHYALGIWSKLISSGTFPQSSSSALQVLQCSIDMLSLVGDLDSQVNANQIVEKIIDGKHLFGDESDDSVFYAAVNSHLSTAKAYDSLGLVGLADSQLCQADSQVKEFLSKPLIEEEPEDNSQTDTTAAVEVIQKRRNLLKLLVLGAKLSHCTLSDKLEEEDKTLNEANSMLQEINRPEKQQPPKTWEEFAVMAELEESIANALLKRGQSGRALDMATTALRHRFTVASVLMPTITENRASTTQVSQVYSRTLFSEWRLLEGLSDSFLQVGWMHELRESIHEAHYFYLRGVSLGSVLNIPKIVWTFLQELGELEYRRGDIELSGKHFNVAGQLMGTFDSVSEQKSKNIPLPPRKDQVLSVMRLGDLQRRIDNHDGAKRRYNEALTMCFAKSLANSPSATTNISTPIEVIARRGDQTPREARILGLAARSAALNKRITPSKGRKTSPLIPANISEQQALQQQQHKVAVDLTLESLAARIEGKLARMSAEMGDVKGAEKYLNSALGKKTSPIVCGVLHLRFAQISYKLVNSIGIENPALVKVLEDHSNEAYESAIASGIPSFMRDACVMMALSHSKSNSLCVNGSNEDVSFFLNSSLGVPICQQVALIEEQQSQKKRDDKGDDLDLIADKIQDLTLKDKEEIIDDVHYNSASVSLFDMISWREHFREKYVDCLPLNWTVVSLSTADDMQSLFLCRLQSHRPSFVLHKTKEYQEISTVLNELAILHKENKETANATATNDEQRTAWWAGRATLDTKFRALLNKIEEDVFGWSKVLLIGPFSEDIIRIAVESKALEFCKKRWKKPSEEVLTSTELVLSAIPFLDSKQISHCASIILSKAEEEEEESEISVASGELESLFKKAMEESYSTMYRHSKLERNVISWGKERPRHPVILVLDKKVQELPLESMPCLSCFAVSRVPSIAFVSALARKDEKSIVQAGIDSNKCLYLVDPASNLPKTANAMRPLIASHPNWKGTSSIPPPDPSELISSLETSDLFLYCGHGSGEQYLPGHELTALLSNNKCPAVLLMGCSSAVLKPQGEFEPTGAPVNWLTAGCPAVIGNLWDVTDGDLDLLTQSLFNVWMPTKTEIPSNDYNNNNSSNNGNFILSLPGALAIARRACKFKSLVGAAAVCYGIPLFCKQQSQTHHKQVRSTTSTSSTISTTSISISPIIINQESEEQPKQKDQEIMQEDLPTTKKKSSTKTTSTTKTEKKSSTTTTKRTRK